jgi:RNA polymerase sigma-70 factor (ECF subfamily)
VRSALDPQAFVEVHDEFAGSLLRYFAGRVDDPQTAVDLTAETLATVYEKRATFRGRSEEEATAWIWRIAHNKLNRFWRQRNVDRRAMQRIGLPRAVATDEDLERIEDLLWIESSGTAVRQAVSGLPADQQTVIRLRYIDELTDQEIAARLSVSQEVVRARASRGLRRLRADARLTAAVDEQDTP